ncbi:MAG: wax ester/triacylglycerol synthase family O-acyltransferase [Deltaproteobacteria bacterium]|nr:wax ester/triacylglycerol synthase family O-acyltransferase [Deltaproteobacteria bacterium]
MEQLSGIDASFLYFEGPTLPMHTLKVALFELEGDLDWAGIRNGIERHLDALEPFRRRLVEIPLGLGHPVWIEDPDFDLDWHLHRCRVEAPGGARELDAVVSRIAARPLDRSRPLWEITLVEGLEAGRVAFVAKIHHSIADGARTLELLRALMDWNGAVGTPWCPERVPERGVLLRLAARSFFRELAALPALVVRTIRGLVAMVRRAKRSAVQQPAPFSGPIAPMNHSLGVGRRFATARLPLDTVLQLKRSAGVTVNDVLLCVCGGALRRYLEERDVLPMRPLIVGVPVDTRDGAHALPGANHVGHIMGTLGTDEADPIKRLHTIANVMREAKARHDALGPDLLERWVQFAPPRLYSGVIRAFAWLRLAEHIPPPINLVVSNVAGPREVLELEGSRLVGLYSVGPILEGIGLNITSWSYAGDLYFGLLSDDRGDLEPGRVAALLGVELTALTRAAGLDAPASESPITAPVSEPGVGPETPA